MTNQFYPIVVTRPVWWRALFMGLLLALSGAPLLANPLLWGGLAGTTLLTLLAWPAAIQLRHLPATQQLWLPLGTV